MARVTNETLGHSDESDGIEEYDNPLPDWWIGMFVGSIIFAAVYPIWFHVMPGHTQAAAYDIEMAAAEVRWPKSEALTELPTDAESIAAGAEIFAQTCASCHKADMTGGIGPNLIDDDWIHGGKDTEILATITNGVSSKGMPAWGAILGPAKVVQVASFVYSKKGTGGSGSPAAATPKPVAPEGTAGAAPNGEELFISNCAACHKADMTGQVGPNLVDDEWIHGGELEQIKATITNGVPDKGMISWGPILEPQEIDALAQFVHSKSHPEGQ